MKNKLMKSIYAIAATAMVLMSCGSGTPSEVSISKETLQDKIKGGWAGQTIGCTFGGPTEFRYRGTMINDNIPIEWPDGYIK